MNPSIRRRVLVFYVAAFIMFALPLRGFSGSVEVVFDAPRLNTDRPFFSALKIAPDGKTAWAGTQKSILRFTGAKRDEFNRENVAAFGAEYCWDFRPLAFDTRGTLWLGLACNKGAPLATFNGSTWQLVTRDILALPEYVKRVELMVFDQNNVMWLVTYSGLVRYDGKEWKLFSPENSPIPHRQISALNIDKNGAVWIGTGQGHIAKFDGAGWEVFKSGPASGLPAGSMAKSIRFDGNGVMYFTNYIGGAYKYVGGKFQEVKCNYGGGSYIEDVVPDHQNVLWITNNMRRGSAREPGLLRQEGKKCRSFHLPNDAGFWIDIDAHGNKWIATSGKFDANGSIIVFKEDGVKLSQ